LWPYWLNIGVSCFTEDDASLSNGDRAEMKSSESSEEDGADGSGGIDEDISDVDEQPLVNAKGVRQPRVFQLSFVNIYGNAEVNRLSDDDKQIKFGRKCVLLQFS
jgi:hypothetical protein